MRTAQEMYEYCLTNNMGHDSSKRQALKHFSVVESSLSDNENVILCFIGLYTYISNSYDGRYFAYAVTSKRLIIAHKNAIGQIIQTILIDSIDNITYQSGILSGIVTVNTFKSTFSVNMSKQAAKNVYDRLYEILPAMKASAQAGSEMPSPTSSQEVCAADEILKYKNLLDLGAITQEEFEAKKKQLLSLP